MSCLSCVVEEITQKIQHFCQGWQVTSWHVAAGSQWFPPKKQNTNFSHEIQNKAYDNMTMASLVIFLGFVQAENLHQVPHPLVEAI